MHTPHTNYSQVAARNVASTGALSLSSLQGGNGVQQQIAVASPSQALQENPARNDLPAELHALEEEIRMADKNKRIGVQSRRKLRKSIKFLPEGADKMIEAPAAIDLWDQCEDFRTHAREQIEWVCANGEPLASRIANKLARPEEYRYFNKSHGIPGIGTNKARIATPDEIDGIPLSEEERVTISGVAHGHFTLEEAVAIIRGKRANKND